MITYSRVEGMGISFLKLWLTNFVDKSHHDNDSNSPCRIKTPCISNSSSLFLKTSTSILFSSLRFGGLLTNSRLYLLTVRLIFKLFSIAIALPAVAAPPEVPAQPYYWHVNKGLNPIFYNAQEGCDWIFSNSQHVSGVVGMDVINNRPAVPYVNCAVTFAPDENGYNPVCNNNGTCVINYASNNYYTKMLLVARSCPNGYEQIDGGRACRLKSTYASPKYPASLTCDDIKGNPIYTAYGNKLQHETDYSRIGSSPLKFERSYNSTFTGDKTLLKYSAANNPLGSIGANWTHTYSRSLKVVRNDTMTMIYAYRPDGRLIFFSLSANGWVTDADITDKVTELKDAKKVTTGYLFTNGITEETEAYDNKGKLLFIKNRKGQLQTLTYSRCTSISVACPSIITPSSIAPYPGLLIKVTDSFSRSLNFTYNTSGKIVNLIDPNGNITSYNYNGYKLITITYPDDTPSDLSNNPKKNYVYGELANLPYPANVFYPDALTGIIDENGLAPNRERYATFKYDTTGRAISTEHATGGIDKYSLTFSTDNAGNPMTTVTDPLLTSRTTHFARVLDVLRSTGTDQPGGSGCSAASSDISYDANGNIASRTDFNGHKTCYAYNLARNLETARIEGLPASADCAASLTATSLPAPARKISTGWHTTYRLPLKIAEPKKLTRYQYDPKGNILTYTEQATTDTIGTVGLNPTVSGSPRTWTYTYNNLGQVLTSNGPRTDVADMTTYTYYASTTADHTKGDLNTISNALKQVTTFSKYDANGRARTITAPNGVKTRLEYYPRGWLKTLTVSSGAQIETSQYHYYPTGLLHTVTQPDSSVLTYGYDDAHRLTSITDSLGNTVTYTLDNAGNRTNEAATDPGNVLRRNISRFYDALNRLQTVTGAEQ